MIEITAIIICLNHSSNPFVVKCYLDAANVYKLFPLAWPNRSLMHIHLLLPLQLIVLLQQTIILFDHPSALVQCVLQHGMFGSLFLRFKKFLKNIRAIPVNGEAGGVMLRKRYAVLGRGDSRPLFKLSHKVYIIFISALLGNIMD